MCGGSPSPRSKIKSGQGAVGTGAAGIPVLGPGPVEEARRAFEMPVCPESSRVIVVFCRKANVSYCCGRACTVDGQKQVAMPLQLQLVHVVSADTLARYAPYCVSSVVLVDALVEHLSETSCPIGGGPE